MSDNPIKLVWATVNANNNYTNFGDALSIIMVTALSNKNIIKAKSQGYVERIAAIGTIGHSLANGKIHVWGTGFGANSNIFNKNTDWYRAPDFSEFNIHATRGRFSELLLQANKIETSGIYGDPGWLARHLVPETVEKKYELGIIVHLSELKPETRGINAEISDQFKRYHIPEHFKGKIKIIHTYAERSVQGVLDKIREIKSCKRILSTSLHGIIMSEMFNIPCAYFGTTNIGGNKSSIYSYNSDTIIDHRFRDFYSSTESHDYVLSYHAPRDTSFDYTLAINFIDKEWVPVKYNEMKLFQSFPYLNIKKPEDMNIQNIEKLLEGIAI